MPNSQPVLPKAQPARQIAAVAPVVTFEPFVVVVLPAVVVTGVPVDTAVPEFATMNQRSAVNIEDINAVQVCSDQLENTGFVLRWDYDGLPKERATA